MRWERRKRYPKEWEALARACKEKAGMQCVFCQVAQGAERISKRTGAVYTVALHAAHKHHDIVNMKPELLCLCPSCHGRYDARYRQQQNRRRLEAKKHRKLLQQRKTLTSY